MGVDAWGGPRVIREGGRYVFTRSVSDHTEGRFDITEDVTDWIAQAQAATTSLELARTCLHHAMCSSKPPLNCEARLALTLLFGREVVSQLGLSPQG